MASHDKPFTCPLALRTTSVRPRTKPFSFLLSPFFFSACRCFRPHHLGPQRSRRADPKRALRGRLSSMMSDPASWIRCRLAAQIRAALVEPTERGGANRIRRPSLESGSIPLAGAVSVAPACSPSGGHETPRFLTQETQAAAAWSPCSEFGAAEFVNAPSGRASIGWLSPW